MGLGSGLVGDIRLNTTLTDEERAKYQNPGVIRQTLHTTRTIAIVGLSPRPERPSYYVGTYLKSEGYTIIPVNPRAAEILGEKAYPDLKSVPVPIDLVNVFRAPEDCLGVAEEAVAVGAKALWLQLRVVNFEAARVAEAAGLQVVMDRCIKIEHGRYGGSLHWVGMNTEIITARRGDRYF